MLKKICILVCLSITLCLFACKTEEPTTEITEEQQIYLPEVEIEGFSNEDYVGIVDIVKGFQMILPPSTHINPVKFRLDSLVYYVSQEKNISFYETEVTNEYVYMAIYSDETSTLTNYENVIFVFRKEDNFSQKFQDKEIFTIFIIQPIKVIRDCMFSEMTKEKTFYFTKNKKYKIPAGKYLMPLERNEHKAFINYDGEYTIFELLVKNNIQYFKHPIYVTQNENGEVSYSGRFSLYPELDNILQYSEKHYQEDHCGLINLDDFIKYVNSLIEEPE